MDYIDKIFKTVSIKDSRRIIELYFQELYCFAPLSNKALSQKLLLPVPIVTAIKNAGIRLGILDSRGLTTACIAGWRKANRQGTHTLTR